MKKVVVSIGGSILFQDKVNYTFIKNLKKLVSKFNRKFIFVIGGGNPARIYIKGLRELGKNEKTQSLTGIAVTRFHARYLAEYFGIQANSKIPHTVKDVKNLLRKDKVVFCGGLVYRPDQTSDSTAAKLAKYFKCDFVNMTNVKGLYDKDPKKFKNAKFIPKISFKDFYKIATKIKYKPGQHFVLDQHASEIIKRGKVKTFIIGDSLKNFENYLKRKKFIGTVIS